MKIYNEEKTNILEDIDLSKGRLINDFITIPEQPFIEEQFHYEVVKEYANGGKDVKKVIDKEGQPFIASHKEEIQVYIPYTNQELEEIEIENLRAKRDYECFSVINRGQLWYNTLSEEQLQELQDWYNAWLNVTETKQIPEKPEWIKV